VARRKHAHEWSTDIYWNAMPVGWRQTCTVSRCRAQRPVPPEAWTADMRASAEQLVDQAARETTSCVLVLPHLPD
jgi:hypothetical protein